MNTIAIKPWTLLVDREATTAAYRSMASDGADTCTCGPCRNWCAARGDHLPAPLRNLFERLGIDATKDVEVYELGPSDARRVEMAGWFAFVGRIAAGPDQAGATSPEYFDIGAGVSIGFSSRCGMTPAAFEGGPVTSLQFTVAIPWVLHAPYPGVPGCS